jgi:hypothetical protein
MNWPGKLVAQDRPNLFCFCKRRFDPRRTSAETSLTHPNRVGPDALSGQASVARQALRCPGWAVEGTRPYVACGGHEEVSWLRPANLLRIMRHINISASNTGRSARSNPTDALQTC